VEDMLEGVPITRLMREPPPAVSPNMPLSTLIYDHVMRSDDRAFPVIDNGHLVGVIYAEKLKDFDRAYWDTTTVKEAMVPENDLEVVTTSEDAMNAFEKLTRKEMRQIPVVRNGQLIGMLRTRDVLRWLQMRSEMMSS
jgi:CBS domain-containing protein